MRALLRHFKDPGVGGREGNLPRHKGLTTYSGQLLYDPLSAETHRESLNRTWAIKRHPGTGPHDNFHRSKSHKTLRKNVQTTGIKEKEEKKRGGGFLLVGPTGGGKREGGDWLRFSAWEQREADIRSLTSGR